MKCSATTKAGNQCSRNALAGTQFCRQHTATSQPQAKTIPTSTLDPAIAEFWTLYASQLIGKLTTNSHIKGFTNNSALTGAYAEVSVQSLTKQMIAPFNTSTGSIISPQLYKEYKNPDLDGHAKKKVLKQLDVIAWAPLPTPPIFNDDGFALVPWQSVLGVLEVKRTIYNQELGQKMTETLEWVEQHSTGSFTPVRRVIDGKPGIKIESDFHWIALGVICIKTRTDTVDAELQKLIDSGRAVILMNENESGGFDVNVSHVMHRVQSAW